MFKKLIFGLGIFTTLLFGAKLVDAKSAYNKGDFKTAFIILEDLASKGDTKAQYNLGVMYANGQDVVKDYKKAFEWFEKSASKEDIDAQYNLGYMYTNGYGTRQDKKIAKEWFVKACDGGHQDGCDSYKKLNQEGY